MGTTRDALRNDSGIELAYTLVIEGYPWILTDGSPAKAVTAWAGTSWSQALPGLQISGTLKQTIAPWSNEVQIPTLNFRVQPEETDQFGIDMFRAEAAVKSELTVGFSTADSAGGAFGISVKDADLFATGQIFVGNESFDISAASGTTLTVNTDGFGFLAPFGTNTGPANTFPGPHDLPAGSVVGAYDSTNPAFATDTPTTWIGKKIGLWVHRVTNGVLDTKAEAEVYFAGTISRISEDGLAASVECDGIQRSLVDATLMQDQWSGRLVEGFYFEAGSYFEAIFQDSGASHHVAAKLTAVASSPGANEFLAGRYTAEQFGSILAEHADADTTVGVSGSSISMRWSSHVMASDQSPRFILTCQEATSHSGKVGILSNTPTALRFLGFTGWAVAGDGGYASVWSDPQVGEDITLTSDRAPYLVPPLDQSDGAVTIELEDTDGSFVDHTSMLPPDAREHVTGAEVWSYYSIGGKTLFLGRRDSDTQISGITVRTSIAEITNTDLDAALQKSNDRENGIVKQVFFATGTLCDLTAKLFASTDGNGENHATYDVLPWGAGIPWDLLGQSFLDSLSSLEQSGIEDSIALLIEKPTQLWDAIRSDFSLRMSAPVWKNGGLQFAQLTVPNATTSDFTLTEANKSNKDRTSPAQTSAYLCHTLKVEINRNPLTGKFQDHFLARDKVGYQSAGGSGVTKTIMARNTYAGGVSSGASAEALADMLTARFLPVFAKPLRTWRRSIPHTMFHMAPGDTVTFSDDFVRDPATGQRGVSVRPAIVLGVQSSLGFSSGGQSYSGIVDLLYTEEDRLFPLAPSAEHAQAINNFTAGRVWTNGYDDEVGTAGVFSMLVRPNKFSDASEPNDATHFVAGDAIRITEMDPADPAAADSFTDSVVSVTEAKIATFDEIVLTTGFGNGGNPAFDGTKTYLVNFDAYNQVQANQTLHAYQADTGDGQILDTAEPNLVGDSVKFSATAADLTELPSRHSAEQFGDGEPVSASLMRDQIRMVNNLLNYKTAPHSPMMIPSGAGVIVSSASATTYVVNWTIPYLIGDESFPGVLRRKLNIAPMFRSGLGGTTANIRVTSSANPPRGQDSTWTDTSWFGPKNQITFSSSSSTYAVATAQELDVVRAENMRDFTWITVEGGDLSQFLGLAELWLGALQ